jgi:hypothetical protein
LRALAGVFCHRYPEFAATLQAAERDPTALELALLALDRLPALNRRGYSPLMLT